MRLEGTAEVDRNNCSEEDEETEECGILREGQCVPRLVSHVGAKHVHNQAVPTIVTALLELRPPFGFSLLCPFPPFRGHPARPPQRLCVRTVRTPSTPRGPLPDRYRPAAAPPSPAAPPCPVQPSPAQPSPTQGDDAVQVVHDRGRRDALEGCSGRLGTPQGQPRQAQARYRTGSGVSRSGSGATTGNLPAASAGRRKPCRMLEMRPQHRRKRQRRVLRRIGSRVRNPAGGKELQQQGIQDGVHVL